MKTVTEKMLQYALGRIVMHYDAPLIRKISRELEEEDYRWSALIHRVVASDPFQRPRMPTPGDEVVVADVSQ